MTASDPADFAPGRRVRIRDLPITSHQRTPLYVRGAIGTVERACGPFRNPESLGHGGDGLPERALIRVRLRQADLWDGYDGPEGDTLDLEIYEHWLEPVEDRA